MSGTDDRADTSLPVTAEVGGEGGSYADPTLQVATFKGERGNQVVDLWLAEEQRALAGGYSGLRITGNVTFLRSEDWALFMEYEELVNKAFQGRRIVTLCTYHLDSCGLGEVYDVVRRHHGALHQPDKGWQITTSQT